MLASQRNKKGEKQHKVTLVFLKVEHSNFQKVPIHLPLAKCLNVLLFKFSNNRSCIFLFTRPIPFLWGTEPYGLQPAGQRWKNLLLMRD